MTATEICATVADKYRIQPAQLRRETRQANRYAPARQEAMATMRRELGWSLVRIGKYFGGFHHTTVSHSIRRESRRIGITCRPDPVTCQELRGEIEELRGRVRQLEAVIHGWGSA